MEENIVGFAIADVQNGLSANHWKDKGQSFTRMFPALWKHSAAIHGLHGGSFNTASNNGGGADLLFHQTLPCKCGDIYQTVGPDHRGY